MFFLYMIYKSAWCLNICLHHKQNASVRVRSICTVKHIVSRMFVDWPLTLSLATLSRRRHGLYRVLWWLEHITYEYVASSLSCAHLPHTHTLKGTYARGCRSSLACCLLFIVHVPDGPPRNREIFNTEEKTTKLFKELRTGDGLTARVLCEMMWSLCFHAIRVWGYPGSNGC